MKLVSVALAFSCALVSAEPPAPGGALLWKTPSEPIPPTEDDFYTEPHDFQTALPGTVLRYREAPGNITAVFPAASKMYNILYRTSDALDRFSWAVTTLMVPKNPYNAEAAEQVDSCEKQGTALLSYQLAYDSCALDSSPSYSLYAESELPTEKDITSALELGWFVSVPDYEGPLASFGSGVQAAHATLDAVRAVLNLAGDNAEIGLSPDAKSTLWGYSGGSVASEWAVELQGSYAPDLHLSGDGAGRRGGQLRDFSALPVRDSVRSRCCRRTAWPHKSVPIPTRVPRVQPQDIGPLQRNHLPLSPPSVIRGLLHDLREPNYRGLLCSWGRGHLGADHAVYPGAAGHDGQARVAAHADVRVQGHRG